MLHHLAHVRWHHSVWFVAYKYERTIPRGVATQLWRDDENLKRQHCYDLTLDTMFAFPSLAPSNWQPGQKIDGLAPAPSIMPRSHLDGRDPLGETQFGASPRSIGRARKPDGRRPQSLSLERPTAQSRTTIS